MAGAGGDRLDRHALVETAWLAGLTAVLVGYLSVWLPGPAAGLSLLGFELGEWIKFLGVGLARNLFYLPPITLGLAIGLRVPARATGWRAWGWRATAMAVSLLAFPSLEAILQEPPSQWAWRLGMVASVGVAALIGSQLSAHPTWQHRAVVLLALLGALLPLGLYLQLRSLLGRVLGAPVGVGWGLWLATAGHLLLAAAAVWFLLDQKRR